jgi:hypothetical protein
VSYDVYLIGSLRNERVLVVAEQLRERGLDVFDQWYSAGPEADDYFWKYAQQRGWSYADALESAAAHNIFAFDKHHLDESKSAVLVMPAGKSGHLELGYMLGRGKPGFVLFDAVPERFDQMYQFANGVHFDVDSLAFDIARVLP